MNFTVEYTTRAIKDLKKISKNTQKHILEESLKLETEPFQFKNKIKKIRGISFPCYRLRIDSQSDSYRLFYGIDKNIVYILRIISKKDADKIIQNIRHSNFPPA
ncbi:type II toxin-antitoxin system RelE/ParE family toxin [candidate division KSB1 bacterium]|nr:type II toxin-antitoxin system RelE/ParE family toxin [candidate division KSB1 bacterium]